MSEVPPTPVPQRPHALSLLPAPPSYHQTGVRALVAAPRARGEQLRDGRRAQQGHRLVQVRFPSSTACRSLTSSTLRSWSGAAGAATCLISSIFMLSVCFYSPAASTTCRRPCCTTTSTPSSTPSTRSITSPPPSTSRSGPPLLQRSMSLVTTFSRRLSGGSCRLSDCTTHVPLPPHPTLFPLSCPPLPQTLMLDCLVLACGLGVDVFNALDVMENKSIFPDLKFGPGDGHLQVRLPPAHFEPASCHYLTDSGFACCGSALAMCLVSVSTMCTTGSARRCSRTRSASSCCETAWAVSRRHVAASSWSSSCVGIRGRKGQCLVRVE